MRGRPSGKTAPPVPGHTRAAGGGAKKNMRDTKVFKTRVRETTRYFTDRVW